MQLKRILYLGYYFKNQDWQKLMVSLKQASLETRKSSWQLLYKSVLDSLKYNVSPLESFQFRFYKKDHKEKLKWAGTGYMYEYQRLMNPVGKRHILDDKTLFYKMYSQFFVHHVHDLSSMKADPLLAFHMLKSSKLVLKESRGKCGLGTAFIETEKFNATSLLKYMERKGYDLAETYIEQHPDLQKLSPSGVNTVRIFTQLDRNGMVEILGCRQRISVNSPVDNLAAGNLAAPIDEATGKISGPGVYNDISKMPEAVHPVTGVSIIGFQVPFWQACLKLAEDAALSHPENRSIGWDIVVTANGPGLIEGNHDWCKLVWQLPLNRGLKSVLEKYMAENQE